MRAETRVDLAGYPDSLDNPPKPLSDVDARILEEDQDTGMQSYKYIRTGENHFSHAFTYAWLSASDETGAHGWLRFMRRQIEPQERANRS